MTYFSITQNGVQLKTCELSISGIFHLLVTGYDRPQVTETVHCKATDKGVPLYLKIQPREI